MLSACRDAMKVMGGVAPARACQVTPVPGRPQSAPALPSQVPTAAAPGQLIRAPWLVELDASVRRRRAPDPVQSPSPTATRQATGPGTCDAHCLMRGNSPDPPQSKRTKTAGLGSVLSCRIAPEAAGRTTVGANDTLQPPTRRTQCPQNVSDGKDRTSWRLCHVTRCFRADPMR